MIDSFWKHWAILGDIYINWEHQWQVEVERPDLQPLKNKRRSGDDPLFKTIIFRNSKCMYLLVVVFRIIPRVQDTSIRSL